jgi:hypothetical protein
MPFQSQAQWRWAFATDQEFAHRWAKMTPGGKRRFALLAKRKRTTTKHLPGKHDQSAHGKPGRVGSAFRGAYSAARAGGASHVEARNQAKSAAEQVRETIRAEKRADRIANPKPKRGATLAERAAAKAQADAKKGIMEYPHKDVGLQAPDMMKHLREGGTVESYAELEKKADANLTYYGVHDKETIRILQERSQQEVNALTPAQRTRVAEANATPLEFNELRRRDGSLIDQDGNPVYRKMIDAHTELRTARTPEQAQQRLDNFNKAKAAYEEYVAKSVQKTPGLQTTLTNDQIRQERLVQAGLVRTPPRAETPTTPPRATTPATERERELAQMRREDKLLAAADARFRKANDDLEAAAKKRNAELRRASEGNVLNPQERMAIEVNARAEYKKAQDEFNAAMADLKTTQQQNMDAVHRRATGNMIPDVTPATTKWQSFLDKSKAEYAAAQDAYQAAISDKNATMESLTAAQRARDAAGDKWTRDQATANQMAAVESAAPPPRAASPTTPPRATTSTTPQSNAETTRISALTANREVYANQVQQAQRLIDTKTDPDGRKLSRAEVNYVKRRLEDYKKNLEDTDREIAESQDIALQQRLEAARQPDRAQSDAYQARADAQQAELRRNQERRARIMREDDKKAPDLSEARRVELANAFAKAGDAYRADSTNKTAFEKYRKAQRAYEKFLQEQSRATPTPTTPATPTTPTTPTATRAVGEYPRPKVGETVDQHLDRLYRHRSAIIRKDDAIPREEQMALLSAGRARKTNITPSEQAELDKAAREIARIERKIQRLEVSRTDPAKKPTNADREASRQEVKANLPTELLQRTTNNYQRILDSGIDPKTKRNLTKLQRDFYTLEVKRNRAELARRDTTPTTPTTPTSGRALSDVQVTSSRPTINKERYGPNKGQENMRTVDVGVSGNYDGRAQPFTAYRFVSLDKGKTWNATNYTTGTTSSFTGSLKQAVQAVQRRFAENPPTVEQAEQARNVYSTTKADDSVGGTPRKYGARAGEVIAGNLGRDTGGKFTRVGEDATSIIRAAINRGFASAAGGGKRGAKRAAVSDAQKKRQQADTGAGVMDALGFDASDWDYLASDKPQDASDPQFTRLIEQGLMDNVDGMAYPSALGRKVAAAAGAGNEDKAKELLARDTAKRSARQAKMDAQISAYDEIINDETASPRARAIAARRRTMLIGQSGTSTKASDGYAPPDGVRAQAKRGLALRSEFGRGGTSVGIARARDLSNGKRMSRDTIMRMVSFFARHAVDKRPDWSNPSKPSNGYIAHLLWGGDAGKSWASKIANQIKAGE